MAGPQYVNLTPYDAQLAALQRQQKYAELLSQQGAEPIDVQSVNGIPTPISPFQGLAKVFQQGVGGYLEGQATKDQSALEASDNAALLDALKNRSTTADVSTEGTKATLPGTTSNGVSTGPYSLDLAPVTVSGYQRTPSELANYDLTQAGSAAMSKPNRDMFLKSYTADQADVDALKKVTLQVNSMLADPKTDPAVKQILTDALAAGDTARINKMLGTIDVNAVPKAPTAQELSDNKDFAAAQLLNPGLTRQQWKANNAGLTAGAEAKAKVPFAIQQAGGEEQARKNVDEKYARYAVPVQIGYTGPDGEEVQTAASWNPKTGQYMDASTKTPIANPQNLRVIGNATGGARSQAAVTRVLTNAADATSGIENLAGLRAGSRAGIFANVANTPAGALTRTVTTQEARDMQTTFAGLGRAMGGLATSGLAVDKDTQESYSNLVPKAGDSQFTAMRQMAELKQQSTNALDVQAKSPILTNEQKKYAAGLSARIKAAIPWSVADVQQLESSGNSGLSLRDIGTQKTNTGGQAGGAAAPGAGGAYSHLTDAEIKAQLGIK